MKVLHLSSEKGWRGGEQQIAYLIDELARAGVENIVAARKDSDFERHCLTRNIKVFPVPFKNSLDLRTAFEIKKICREHQIDVVHMHSAKSHSLGVLSTFVGNTSPLILSRRVDFVPKNKWFTRWKYNHPSIKRVVCVSEKINTIMRAYLTNPSLSVTVHSGVDLNKFNRTRSGNKLREEFNIAEKTFLVGNSSALEGHKDYFTFIKTIEILIHRNLDVHAFIMGSGSLERDLKNFAAERSMLKHITFTGFRKDIVDLLPCLDVFLMTSNEEGLGTSVLDAFLAGAVVVATAAGGIPEMVVHEKSGLLAGVADATALANNVSRVMGDVGLRQILVKGQQEMVRNFSKEKTAEKTLAIYREVLADKR